MPEWLSLNIAPLNLAPLTLCCISYFTGAISSAILTCKMLGLEDPRQLGSLNPGASNVLRNHGKLPSALTFLGDVLKVVIPIGVGSALELTDFWLSWIAFSACVGHMYPVYYRFSGGKGVASAFGAITILSWPIASILGLIWVIIAKLSKTAALGSISVWILAPLMIYFTEQQMFSGFLAISLLILLRHKDNIRRLTQGTENHLS